MNQEVMKREDGINSKTVGERERERNEVSLYNYVVLYRLSVQV